MAQLAQRAAGEPILATPGHRNPTGEVRSMREGADCAFRFRHDPQHTRSLRPSMNDRAPGPGAEDGLVFLERSIADQQADQITLLEGPLSRPGKLWPVLVQQHFVACAQSPGRNPFKATAIARCRKKTL